MDLMRKLRKLRSPPCGGDKEQKSKIQLRSLSSSSFRTEHSRVELMAQQVPGTGLWSTGSVLLLPPV